MKLARFGRGGEALFGVAQGEVVQQIQDDGHGGYRVTDREYLLGEVKLLPPCLPSKIIGIGLNYRSHAEEIGLPVPGEPMVFLKAPSALIGHDERILYPAMSRRVDFEGELAVVIAEEARGVSEREALSHVLGYTCINDVTARDIQQRGHMDLSKGMDTFAPLGPFIETDLDPSDLLVQTRLNGELRQQASTADMVFSVPRLIEYISAVMTLFPGDIIATGTPAGIGPMVPGDVVEVIVEGIGTLRSFVVSG
ncbi:MAG: fumarylacetoacetate hydrolase family protein [Chloroflexota bacterium]|nr:fumarylacetoacetate hydrolase family protein [Chloroflexota bacterium]